jgi:hypothetical protein
MTLLCPKMDQDQVPPHRPRKAFVVSTHWPSTPSHNLTSQPFCSTLPDPLTLPTQQLCIPNVPLQPLRRRWHVPLTQWLSLHDYMVPTTQKTTVISLPHLSPSGLSVMVSELPHHKNLILSHKNHYDYDTLVTRDHNFLDSPLIEYTK